MKWQLIGMFLATATVSTVVDNDSNVRPIGILDNIINKTLESLRPKLKDLKIPCETFETGDQEFGNFKGEFNDVTVEDLDKFEIKILQTSLIDIKNLTIVEETIRAKGLYKINGSLAFPLGKNDIHFFGDGTFWAELSNLSFSLKIKLRNENGMNVVKDLDIIIQLEKIKIRLTNLMGGGDLEEVFNMLINDVGLTVFDYYKEPILEAVKPEIKKIITEMLNQKEKNGRQSSTSVT